MEIWKDIEGYEGIYQVSSEGRVKSLNYHRTGQERILKASCSGWGYPFVNLCKDGKKKTHRVHRLVAIAFIENPDNLPEINHKDEDKANNNVDNLEWCNRKYNVNYGTHNQRMAEALRGENHYLYGKHLSEETKKKMSESLSKPVMCIHKINGYMVEYNSIKEAEKYTGIDNSAIAKCCKGKRRSAGGYKWFYI